MQLHTNKWNKRDKELTMLIITEGDIKNDSVNVRGFGFELLVIPNKYKIEFNPVIDLAKRIVLSRMNGEIIYV
jgi:hypothetical protein